MSKPVDDYILILKKLTDVSDSGSNADLDPRIALFGEFALEELVQFGIEHTIGDELPLL